MKTMVVASSVARLPADADRRTDLTLGRHHLVADSPTTSGPATGPSALELLTASLAACTAMSARTWLARHRPDDTATGEVEVGVDYDLGPPTLFHRRVQIPAELTEQERHALSDALESTPVTAVLRLGLQVRTHLTVGGDEGGSVDDRDLVP